MTVSGSGTPEGQWDEARIALGRVGKVMWDNPAVRLEELRMLENYEAIPLPVREALEGMSPEERRAVTRIITTLGENGFYLEGGHGGLAWV